MGKSDGRRLALLTFYDSFFLSSFSFFLLLFLLVLFVVTLCDLGRFDRNLCVFMRMWLGRI